MQELNKMIQSMLADASVLPQALPQCPSIQLYLVDPQAMQRPFSLDEIRAIWEHTAYWAFCWASGQVLARFILENPSWVKGKRILDFGTGSGVVAIAAKLAGAQSVMACDIDQDAIVSCYANARLNNTEFETSYNLFDLPKHSFDLLIAADVLYDRENLSFLDTFFDYADNVLLADSRIKDFHHTNYRALDKLESFTVPDLDELDEFRWVNLYHGTIN